MNKRIVLRAGAAGFILLLAAGASRAQDNPAPKDSAKPTPALSLPALRERILSILRFDDARPALELVRIERLSARAAGSPSASRRDSPKPAK